MLAFVIELFAIVGFAALSDRIGRRPVYMFGALAGIALAFPFFWMVGTKEWIWIAVAFILARGGGDGGDVRAAGGLFRRTVPAAAALCRLCLRPRTGFAAGRRSGAVRGDRAGGMVGKLVAGRLLRGVALRPAPRSRSGAVPRPIEESITVDNTSDGNDARGSRAAAGLKRRWRSNSASCSRSGRWSGGGPMQPEWPLQTQLAMIRDAGFDGAGVRFIDPGLRHAKSPPSCARTA